MRYDREVKNLKPTEVIEDGRVVGDCIPKTVDPLWGDTRYFELDEPGVIVAWLPKVGIIRVDSEVSPPSAAPCPVDAMKYSDLDIFTSFEDLAMMDDEDVLALIRERRMSAEDYYKAWGF